MSNIRRTLQMTSLLFGMVVLFCYIAWHLGYDGFILVGHITIPEVPLYLIQFVLFSINFTFMAGFSVKEYSWKIIKLILPYLCLNFIVEIFYPGLMMSGPASLIYLWILGLIRKDFKWTFIRSGLASVITIGYQFLAMSMKNGYLSFSYTTSVYNMLMMSIDMIILSLLFWSVGGVKSGSNNKKLELVVFPGRVRDDQYRNESSLSLSTSAHNIPVGRFELWVMRSVIAAVQILQWMFILWVCSLDNLFLDALVMTTSFICHGIIIAKRKHFKPIILCTLVATAMFYFAARFTISFRYSHFFPIVVGLLLVYTVYRISYQLEKAAKEKAKADLERIKKLEAQMSEAWKHIDKLS